MIIGWCFICAFAVLISKVCLQVTVVGFIGGSVVLPCSSTAHNFKLQDINVLWRDKRSESICNVIKGEDSVERQGVRYKNRTETFPEDYLRGNFSIKLKNLTRTDAGEFSCFITHSHELCTVQLIINETAGKGNQSSEQENHGPETQSDWTVLICVFIVLIVIIVVAGIMAGFMYHRKKRFSADYIGVTMTS
ncbi:V-set domain-containing T-cell activation inhibitor 1-like [Labeo rohita]|uniref:V-set domain-containing T-cell activation inhibitor 1-like n=1 Tax=Labeo rohita TaxID=84645 RepID=UPI0021E22D73|nr:V-set domain-containing T-cell activation inhibitor 1-like [Labeo rohita]